MIDLYRWLFDAQEKIILRIEKMTGIRVPPSFITIASIDGLWGSFTPESGHLDADVIDGITLDKKLFGMGKEFVLMVLGHELLHGAEKIINNLDTAHSPDFRMWEMELNKFAGNYPDPMPQIDFEHYHLWKVKSAISKLITYECRCSTQITHSEEIDVSCNKCGHKFHIIDDGRLDFADELRVRVQLLLHTVKLLMPATDDQLYRYRVLGMDRKIAELCKPIAAEPITDEILDGDTVMRLMNSLHKRVLNVCSMNGATVDSKELARVLFVISGNSKTI